MTKYSNIIVFFFYEMQLFSYDVDTSYAILNAIFTYM